MEVPRSTPMCKNFRAYQLIEQLVLGILWHDFGDVPLTPRFRIIVDDKFY